MMKSLTLLFASSMLCTLSFAAHASNPAEVAKCVSQLNCFAWPSTPAACEGVETDTDVAAVVSCVKKLNRYLWETTPAACAGVRTTIDVAAVVSCVQSLDGHGYGWPTTPLACKGAKGPGPAAPQKN